MMPISLLIWAPSIVNVDVAKQLLTKDHFKALILCRLDRKPKMTE